MGNETLRSGVQLAKQYVCEKCGKGYDSLDAFVQCEFPGCKVYRCASCIQRMEVAVYNISRAGEDDNGRAACFVRSCQDHVDDTFALFVRAITRDRVLRAMRATARAIANGKEEAADYGGE